MNDEGKKYDKIAEDFAKLRNSFNTEKKYIDQMLALLKPDARILDIGCGSGYPLAAYIINKGFTVIGIDSSKELLKIAKQKCPALKTIFGDIRTVQLNQQFDAIMEWWCLFHVPCADHEKMIKRFSSWLKMGGVLEFTTGDHEYQHADAQMLNQELNFYSLSPDKYEKYLQQNHFKIIQCEHDQEDHLVWLAVKDK